MISNELLKKKILDEAIHGKLVENDPSLKPVDVEESTDKLPFEIPNNWKWVEIKNVVNMASGGTPSRNIKEYWENGNIPWVKISDMKEKYLNSTDEFITNDGLKNSSAKLFSKGTILYSIFATIGNVSILNIDASTNQAIVGLTPKVEIDINFLYFILKHIKDFINQLGKGTSQLNINQQVLKKTLIPLPPLEEQEKIVKKIEELFQLIDKKEKNDKAKEKLKILLKEKILDSAIHGKLVENDLSLPAIDIEEVKADIPFNIPSNWKYTYLNNVGIWKAGSTPLKDNLDYYRDGNIPWVLTGDLNDGILSTCKHYITEKAFNECSLKLNKIGSVLIAMYGATIGRVAINLMKVTTNQACCACECYDNIIYNKYLFYYLIGIREELKAKAEGAGQPNISKQKIINYKILLPPLKLQKKIVEKIEECFKLIEQL